jgi:hypothetical protein
MDSKEKLRQQITDSAGNIPYTFSAHWNIVHRLKKRYMVVKIVQIGLTAVSTGGFLASIIAGIPWLSWVGGLTSTVALGLNLYMLNFNLPDNIKSHTDAANELWDVREAYKSLLIDLDDLEPDEIRIKRDALIERVSQINKKYPGTDDKSFKQAQADSAKYQFEDGEAVRLLHVEQTSRSQAD